MRTVEPQLPRFGAQLGEAANPLAKHRILLSLLPAGLMVSILVMFADVAIGDRLALVLMVFFVLVVCGIAVLMAERLLSGSQLLAFKCLLGYLVAAYLIKLPYCLLLPGEIPTIEDLGKGVAADAALEAFTVFTVGFAGISAGFLLPAAFVPQKRGAYLLRAPQWRPTVFLGLASLSFAGLLLKFVAYTILKIGIPGTEGNATGVNIPFVGGLTVFFVRNGLFLVVNALFLYSFLAPGRFPLFVGISAVLVFVGLDISVGSKFSIIFQAFVSLMYYAGLEKNLGVSAKRRRALRWFLIFIVAAILVGYKYVNYYRYATLSGSEGSAALQTALRSGENREGHLGAIVNRINGIDNIMLALAMKRGLNPNFGNLVNDEFTRVYTRAVTGLSSSNNANGATQFSLLYLINRSMSDTFFGMALFGMIFAMISKFVQLIAGRSMFGQMLCGPIIAIAMINILFGAGDLIFAMKGLTVLLLTLFMIRGTTRKADSTQLIASS